MLVLLSSMLLAVAVIASAWLARPLDAALPEAGCGRISMHGRSCVPLGAALLWLALCVGATAATPPPPPWQVVTNYAGAYAFSGEGSTVAWLTNHRANGIGLSRTGDELVYGEFRGGGTAAIRDLDTGATQRFRVPHRPRRYSRVVIRNLATGRVRRVAGYRLQSGTPILSADGRYLLVRRGSPFRKAGTGGVLDLKTLSFTAMPRSAAGWETEGLQTISGDGTWVLYWEVHPADFDVRWWLFNRATRAKTLIGQGRQWPASIADDGSKAFIPNLGLYDRLTRQVNRDPFVDGRFGYLVWGPRAPPTALTADATMTAFGCGPVLTHEGGPFDVFTRSLISGAYTGFGTLVAVEDLSLAPDGARIFAGEIDGRLLVAPTAAGTPAGTDPPSSCATAAARPRLPGS